jgi:hypothetical protein
VANALLFVPPFLKLAYGPLLGPAMLIAAGRRAGHDVEALACWGIEQGLFKATTKGRIADHAKWAAWVSSQRATIASYANPGMADQLFSRVLDSDAGRESDVQRVFKGEDIGLRACTPISRAGGTR